MALEITLRSMRFHALIGILPHERTTPQPVEIDLTVTVQPGEGVVDYRRLYEIAASAASAGPIDYLEDLGERIARGAENASSVAVPDPDLAYVALGSNMGDRQAHLSRALAALQGLPGTEMLAASGVEETPPLGSVPQDAYLNQMVLLRTELGPRELLRHLQAIEQQEGRTRTIRWGPRTIDLDIVRFGRQVVNLPDLKVPHPELANRTFWQRQASELEARIAESTGNE
jgi:2-amino-4-hydroxy-6-hydroxymethyldihydropteridine diphosphokinase